MLLLLFSLSFNFLLNADFLFSALSCYFGALRTDYMSLFLWQQKQVFFTGRRHFGEIFQSHYHAKSCNILAVQTSFDLRLSSSCDCSVGCRIFSISTTVKLAQCSILFCPSCFSVRTKLISGSRVITCLNSRNIANFG